MNGAWREKSHKKQTRKMKNIMEAKDRKLIEKGRAERVKAQRDKI